MIGIDLLMSSPLPTIVSTIVAVSCLAGFYFFVIPMMGEAKALRNENKQLKDVLEKADEAHLKKLFDQNEKLNDVLAKLETEIRSHPDRAMEKVVAALAKLDDLLGKKDTANISALIEIKSALTGVAEHSNGAKSRDEALHNLIHENMRILHSISDKQSQIIGALLGMNRLQDRNRSL